MPYDVYWATIFSEWLANFAANWSLLAAYLMHIFVYFWLRDWYRIAFPSSRIESRRAIVQIGSFIFLALVGYAFFALGNQYGNSIQSFFLLAPFVAACSGLTFALLIFVIESHKRAHSMNPKLRYSGKNLMSLALAASFSLAGFFSASWLVEEYGFGLPGLGLERSPISAGSLVFIATIPYCAVFFAISLLLQKLLSPKASPELNALTRSKKIEIAGLVLFFPTLIIFAAAIAAFLLSKWS